jgi:peptide/nickel transport system ATP-binding protein
LINSLPSRNKRGQRLRQIPGMTPNLIEMPSGCAFAERCSRASAECAQEPENLEIEPGRMVRCFHPGEAHE